MKIKPVSKDVSEVGLKKLNPIQKEGNSCSLSSLLKFTHQNPPDCQNIIWFHVNLKNNLSRELLYFQKL